ncbi:MAG TPA: EEP domain-containing protein, partial [Casimicrobiaceae bacterium]|nr:EEP domain-containing protein [Casimicrobiaceae bacterium]
ANHRGPIIVGGDFNTWNEERSEVVRALAGRLGLTPVVFPLDERKRFMGRIFDWVYARGITVLSATAWTVTSSDHNPVVVSFRVP